MSGCITRAIETCRISWQIYLLIANYDSELIFDLADADLTRRICLCVDCHGPKSIRSLELGGQLGTNALNAKVDGALDTK